MAKQVSPLAEHPTIKILKAVAIALGTMFGALGAGLSLAEILGAGLGAAIGMASSGKLVLILIGIAGGVAFGYGVDLIRLA